MRLALFEMETPSPLRASPHLSPMPQWSWSCLRCDLGASEVPKGDAVAGAFLHDIEAHSGAKVAVWELGSGDRNPPISGSPNV